MTDLQSHGVAHVDIDIPFFDVDSMNMAWHGHYAKYLETARCQLLETIGHDYQAMFDSGYAWPVVDLRVRYLRPLRFKQPIRVTARLKRWDHQLAISYRIHDRTSGAALARASTLQAPIDKTTGELYHGRPAAVERALARLGANWL